MRFVMQQATLMVLMLNQSELIATEFQTSTQPLQVRFVKESP